MFGIRVLLQHRGLGRAHEGLHAYHAFVCRHVRGSLGTSLGRLELFAFIGFGFGLGLLGLFAACA